MTGLVQTNQIRITGALARGGFQVLTSLLRVVAYGSICPLSLRETTGPFASGPVCLRLVSDVCAQECAQHSVKVSPLGVQPPIHASAFR